jgi:hypothetical protein
MSSPTAVAANSQAQMKIFDLPEDILQKFTRELDLISVIMFKIAMFGEETKGKEIIPSDLKFDIMYENEYEYESREFAEAYLYDEFFDDMLEEGRIHIIADFTVCGLVRRGVKTLYNGPVINETTNLIEKVHKNHFHMIHFMGDIDDVLAMFPYETEPHHCRNLFKLSITHKCGLSFREFWNYRELVHRLGIHGLKVDYLHYDNVVLEPVFDEIFGTRTWMRNDFLVALRRQSRSKQHKILVQHTMKMKRAIEEKATIDEAKKRSLDLDSETKDVETGDAKRVKR